jgi:hypothetical protein
MFVVAFCFLISRRNHAVGDPGKPGPVSDFRSVYSGDMFMRPSRAVDFRDVLSDTA